MVKKTLLGLALIGMAGCATDDAHMVSPEEFARSRPGQIEARQLRPGDAIEFTVEVNGATEIPRTTVELDYDGMVLAPLIGDVKLDSLTLSQAREALEAGYTRIFVAPPLIRLQLADRDIGEWGYVTVLGQVRNPGRFAITSIAGMSLSDAIHEAGGFTENANIHGVVATRSTPDGKQIQCAIDVSEIGKVNSGHRDLDLFYGDIIYVPERLF
jgi:protein involved in polysaccharide export with SLBB domain